MTGSKPKWTPQEDAEIIRLRDVEHLRFWQVAESMGRTKGEVMGRYHRAKGTPFPSNRRERPKHPISASHRIYDLKPAKYPYAPDCSSYDFANDDDHCAAVLAIRAYPVMPSRAA